MRRTQAAESPTVPVVVDDCMKRLYQTAGLVASRPSSVLITGETGVGKEVLAQALHDQSARRGPLVAMNCANIPRALTESTLFGHEGGSFTDAKVSRKGLFEEADGGTLFLDEVAELSSDAQAALLRILQDNRSMRVGSARAREVDVRVISATHRDLSAMATRGRFRQDLLYRLETFTLHVPPLRERRGEILPLAHLFLQRFGDLWGEPVRLLGPTAKRQLLEHDWPGNIRQLQNIIERAATLSGGQVIDSIELPARAAGNAETGLQHGSAGTRSGLKEQVRAFEMKLIREALNQAHGNISQAARLLQLPPRTLNSKIHAYSALCLDSGLDLA